MNNNFYIKKIKQTETLKTIKETGFDSSYVQKAIKKYEFELYKIKNLTCEQATIIKQIAISVGADAAVHREVLTHKVEKTDLLIGATKAQLLEITKKLKYQPFKLNELSKTLEQQLEIKLLPLKIRNTIFNWKKTVIMGILNVTPDSFSDGGDYYSADLAIEQAFCLIEDGADIIDIGGESTKPYADKVESSEEINRIIPVIKGVREKSKDIIISIDTRNAKTAQEALKAGADIINDVSGCDYDLEMKNVVKEFDCPIVIMHSKGNPNNMQDNPKYENVVDEVYEYLYDKVQDLINFGIKKENIIIDTGIGFGKTLEHNIELVKRNIEFTSIGCPVLIGVSRKSIIAKILDIPPKERDEATIALNTYLTNNGANIIRVHNVKKHKQAFCVMDKILF